MKYVNILRFSVDLFNVDRLQFNFCVKRFQLSIHLQVKELSAKKGIWIHPSSELFVLMEWMSLMDWKYELNQIGSLLSKKSWTKRQFCNAMMSFNFRILNILYRGSALAWTSADYKITIALFWSLKIFLVKNINTNPGTCRILDQIHVF